MAIKDMIANMRSFDLQINSSCQYQKKHMRRVWRKWILMSGCKGLISTNSGCSFCHDHVDHITMHSTALTTRPPLPWLHRTHYIAIKQPLPHLEFLHLLSLMIFSEPVRRKSFVFHLWRTFCLLWTFVLIQPLVQWTPIGHMHLFLLMNI